MDVAAAVGPDLQDPALGGELPATMRQLFR